MASTRSIEVKVGVLILTAIGLLAAFVLVMGGINFQPTYTIKVDFDNPGGVQTGAPVKIAGVKVGKIEDIRFQTGNDESTGRRLPLVRMTVKLEKRYQESIRENALFYVTTQGVLGEQFLAIEPGSSDAPVLDEASKPVRGLDPPRLDMLLAESYELLHSTVLAVRENREELGETFAALRTTLKATSTLLNGNQERFDRILANVETATVEGNTLIKEGSTLVKNVNEKYVDSPRTERILDNVDAVAANVARETPPLLADARVTAENARRFSDSVANEEQAAKIKKVVDDTSTLLTKANATASDAQFMVAQMRKGRGSVGALLMDEQLFDDLQEMVRDLKHNPWKFFWRE